MLTILRKVFDFLRSKVLALALMIIILLVILIATVFLTADIGHRLVFSTLWFNALLILLVVNTACCFFSRIHRRGWNLVSTGMIIFHLSFVALFAGVIVNSLFHFKGALRMMEGETIGVGKPSGYDEAEWGTFFNHSWLRGDVTLRKLYTDYKEGGDNKGAAYDISIVEGKQRAKGVIYPTRHLTFKGCKFLRNKEGYAPLFILYDRSGKVVYGGYIPLQSFPQGKEGVYIYTTGTKQEGPGAIAFPPIPGMPPLYKAQFTYHMPKSREDVKKASFLVWEYDREDKNGQGRLVYQGTASMGEKVAFDNYALEMQEMRHWVSMDVLFDPGSPLVFFSLWAGLGGIALTIFGRLLHKRKMEV